MSHSFSSLVLKGLGSNIFLFIIAMLLLLFIPIPFLNAFILPALLISSFIFLSEWFKASFWKQFLINISFTATLIWIISIFLSAFGPVYIYICSIALLFSVGPSSWWTGGRRYIHNIMEKTSTKHILIRNLITLGIFVGVFLITWTLRFVYATRLDGWAVVAGLVWGVIPGSLAMLGSVIYHSLRYDGNSVESSFYTLAVNAWFIPLSFLSIALSYVNVALLLGIAVLSAGFAKKVSSTIKYQAMIAVSICLVLVPLHVYGYLSVESVHKAAPSLNQPEYDRDGYTTPSVNIEKVKITAHPNGSLNGMITTDEKVSNEFSASVELKPYARSYLDKFYLLIHSLVLQDYAITVAEDNGFLAGRNLRIQAKNTRVYDDFDSWYGVPRYQRDTTVTGPTLKVSLGRGKNVDVVYIGEYASWEPERVNQSIVMEVEDSR